MMCEKCFYEFLNSFIGGDSIEFAAEKMPNVKSEYQAYETMSFGVSGVYEDGNGNVNVLFSDGTTETSVCHPEDVYDSVLCYIHVYQVIRWFLVKYIKISISRAGIPNHWDLMPDDLRWS